MKHGAQTIVFDLDGTLVDSLPDILSSFQHGFTQCGLAVPDELAIRAEIGKPLEEMYAAFAPGRVEELCAAHREHYARNFTVRTRPYPGVPELLETLRSRGYLLAVATAKRTDMARRFMAALGMAEWVDCVQGTDGFPHKPAPEVIYRALKLLGSQGLWMVGDTITDVQAGRAAGLKTYAVSWGTHSAEQLATASPDELHPNLELLLERLPPVR
jgi:phosphoglycolate phosphatase